MDTASVNAMDAQAGDRSELREDKAGVSLL